MSESATTDVFECPQCGRKGKWSPSIAGRKVKCKCGTSFTAPASMDGSPAAEVEKPTAPVKPPTKAIKPSKPDPAAPASAKKEEANKADPKKEESKPAGSAALPANSKVKPAPTYLASAPRSEGGAENKDSRLETRPGKIDKSAPPAVVKKVAPRKKSADPDEGLYELAPAHDPPKNFKPAPPAGEGGEAAAAAPTTGPGGFGTAIQPRKKYVDEPPGQKAKNFTFPLMLICAAIILNIMYGAFLQQLSLPFGGVFKETLFRFILSAGILVGGMMVFANVLKVDFGPQGLAIFKTIGIAASPMTLFGFGAVLGCTFAKSVTQIQMGLIDQGWLQFAIDAGLSLVLYVVLFGYLLDMKKAKIYVPVVLWAVHVGAADLLIRIIAQPPPPIPGS